MKRWLQCWLRWPMAALFLASAAAWGGSHIWGWDFDATSSSHMGLGGGHFTMLKMRPQPGVSAPLSQVRTTFRDLGDLVEIIDGPPTLPWFRTNAQGWVLSVPLWSTSLLLGALAAWSWWPTRFRPGRCPKCGYDRAGLEARAVCPECGTLPLEGH